MGSLAARKRLGGTLPRSKRTGHPDRIHISEGFAAVEASESFPGEAAAETAKTTPEATQATAEAPGEASTETTETAQAASEAAQTAPKASQSAAKTTQTAPEATDAAS
jgi:hypothetical protein